MRIIRYAFVLVFMLVLLDSRVAFAELVVTVLPIKPTNQEAVIPIIMTNHLSLPIESARATIFVIGESGRMVGSTTQWVINKKNGDLNVGQSRIFNFVIRRQGTIGGTNLSTKLQFNRIVLSDKTSLNCSTSVLINRR